MASKKYENALAKKGYQRIAGIDEAGRGPLAGPVVACALILPKGFNNTQLTDSKKLTPERREAFYQELIGNSDIDYGVGIVSSEVIDRINILQATFEAFKLAIAHLKTPPDYLLYDGNLYPQTGIPSEAIVSGDFLCQSIAAASIIAKVVRDEMMRDYCKRWPEYAFSTHKGYATKAHLQSLEIYGPCPIHRFSFAPIKHQLTLLEAIQNHTHETKGSCCSHQEEPIFP
jgi:ribonuclease HII